MKTYTHIVFDIDGTLTDTEYAAMHSLQDTVQTLRGKRIAMDELQFAFGIPGANSLAQLQIDDIPAGLELWGRNMMQYTDTISVFDGMRDVLAHLADAGYMLGIVTSKVHTEYIQDFIPYGIADYFRTVICADDTTEHKPMPAPLLKYQELTGAAAGAMLYIGDSVYDQRCARGAGVDFALAGWGAMQKLEADFCLQQPGELWELLKP